MNPSSIEQAIQFNKTGLRNAAATNSQDGKKLGKQDFLNLLMTQMANQDPLDPMKSESMMQQLAAMGTVEQLQNLNAKTSELMGVQEDISRASASNLLGRDVEIGSQSVNLKNGQTSAVSYRLAGDADRAQLIVHDVKGEVVKSLSLDNLNQGTHQFHWDGRDEDGDLLPNGEYQYSVFAKTNNGEDISISYSKSGRVNMVRFEGTNPMVQINSEWMPAKQILSIDDRSSNRYGSAIPLPLRSEIESRKPNLSMLDHVKTVQLD